MASSKSYNMKAAIAAFVILPILGVLILSRAQWVHKELPYIGEKVENKDGSVTYHTVGDVHLFNQHGKEINLSDFDSCIIVANIFFASCAEVCPQMNKQIQVIAEEFRTNPKVRFLTVSIDPQSDSVPVLYQYSQAYKADLYKRTFATGSKSEIYDWVFNDLLLATEQRGSDFIHDDKVVIIDRDHHIRGILETRGKDLKEQLERVKRITDDINNLLYEYRQKQLDK